jgi:Na+-transporting methylmalonyl-CoA/oxaloacetate decarboxylase gamma subunit
MYFNTILILLLLIFVIFFVSGVVTRMFTAMSVHRCPIFEKMMTATRVHICPTSKNNDNKSVHIYPFCVEYLCVLTCIDRLD